MTGFPNKLSRALYSLASSSALAKLPLMVDTLRAIESTNFKSWNWDRASTSDW